MANDDAAPAGAAAVTTQQDAAPSPPVELNVADNPELDRNLEAVGQRVDDAKEKAGPELGSQDDEVTVGDYDHERSRDGTRQIITLWLIGLLCAIVALTFVALFARGASSGFTDKQFFTELKQVLDVLVGPVITLLASAVGFYFGYKQGELGEQARNNKLLKE